MVPRKESMAVVTRALRGVELETKEDTTNYCFAYLHHSLQDNVLLTMYKDEVDEIRQGRLLRAGAQNTDMKHSATATFLTICPYCYERFDLS